MITSMKIIGKLKKLLKIHHNHNKEEALNRGAYLNINVLILINNRNNNWILSLWAKQETEFEFLNKI